MQCSTIGSCQSAATSEIVKRCWSRVLTHVSGAIASVQTFTFLTFTPLHTSDVAPLHTSDVTPLHTSDVTPLHTSDVAASI